MRIALPLWIGAALVLMLLLAPGVAQAQAVRTWVSGVGDDANPCSRTAPCKTFPGAISKTAAGGAIDVLDPGGFGTVTISKSITLEGAGTLAGISNSGLSGIIINAGASDRVVLRNLIIDGAGTTLGVNGIRVLAAGSVLIEDVTILNDSNNGIDILSSAAVDVVLRNVTVNNVAGAAVQATASAASVTLDVENSRFNNVGLGIYATDRSVVHASHVQVSDASVAAFEAFGGGNSASLLLDDSSATASAVGILSNGADSVVRLAHTTLSGNVAGISAMAGGQVISFGNNRLLDSGGPTSEIGEQ